MVFSGKRIVVTGGTRGIGRAVCEHLSRDGAQVTALARSVPPGALSFDVHPVDLAKREAVEAALAELSAQGPVFGLVNNAGIPGPQAIEDLSDETFDQVMQMNLFAAVQAVRALSPGMVSEGVGRIVNISTELILGYPSRTSYASSKAGLTAATRTWALELGPHGITSNAVAPGPVETEFFQANNPPGSAVRAAKLAKIPVGRFGQPEDIARVVALLLDPRSSYINGQTWFVDGGSSLGAGALF